MARKQDHVPGPQFVRYFGPILDALRTLGGSGAPSEEAEKQLKGCAKEAQ